MKKRILVLVGLGICTMSFAQQSTRLSQFFFNPMLVNTAASGASQFWTIGGGFKTLFSNVPGAPQTQFVSVDGPVLNRKLGLGLTLENDVASLLAQRKVVGHANYRIRLSQKNWLAIGVGVGFKQHTIDGAKSTFETGGDNAISTVYMSNFAPSTAIGAYFFNKRTTIGLSGENVIRYKIDYTDVNRAITSRSTLRINAQASYRIPLSKDWTFIPNVLIKIEPRNPFQVDLTPMIEIRQRFRLGLGYRFKESTSIIIQNDITEKFSAGYSYDFQTNGLASVSNGSHELMLRYRFVKKINRFVNPRSY